MKQIPLSRGLFALVDDEDYELLAQHTWCALKAPKTFYAVRNASRKSEDQRMIYMHRVLEGITDKNIPVDHKDGDGLNNTRSNLRVCTKSQNNLHRGAPRTNTSGVKGVSFCTQTGKWKAYTFVEGKQIWGGRHSNFEDACEAFNRLAEQYHGDFAK